MKDYTPNPRIVRRACDLWIAALSNPKYDNLGENSPEPPESKRANGLASILASMIPKNNTPDVLQKFGDELFKVLMAPLEWTSNWNNKEEKFTTLFRDLGVDYHPDIPLRTAAERSGLDMEFPWKSHMWLNEDSLSFHVGYGAPNVYHYPLSNERWLETTLHGDDIGKLIALVESGVLTLDLQPALLPA